MINVDMKEVASAVFIVTSVALASQAIIMEKCIWGEKKYIYKGFNMSKGNPIELVQIKKKLK